MKLNGMASAGMNVAVGNFKLMTNVVASGASMLSTAEKNAFRELGIPFGGKITLSSDALMSAEVSGSPLWNFTPERILKVYFLPPSVAVGTSPSHRSQANAVGEDGLSGSTRMSNE